MTVHAIAVLLVAVAIFCRARHMDQNTPTKAKLQHGSALIAAVASLPIFVPPPWGPGLLGVAMYLFLMLDSRYTAKGGAA